MHPSARVSKSARPGVIRLIGRDAELCHRRIHILMTESDLNLFDPSTSLPHQNPASVFREWTKRLCLGTLASFPNFPISVVTCQRVSISPSTSANRRSFGRSLQIYSATTVCSSNKLSVALFNRCVVFSLPFRRCTVRYSVEPVPPVPEPITYLYGQGQRVQSHPSWPSRPHSRLRLGLVEGPLQPHKLKEPFDE